jgi:ankyrin repeat protein
VIPSPSTSKIHSSITNNGNISSSSKFAALQLEQQSTHNQSDAFTSPLSTKLSSIQQEFQSETWFASANSSEERMSLLSKAIIRGKQQHIQDLLSSGAVLVDETDKHGCTMAMHAAKYGKSDVLELLLRWKADVNKVNSLGCSALWEAARFGQSKSIENLLRYKADVKLANHKGETPLHRACANGQTDAIDTLLSAAGSESEQMSLLTATDNGGWTALMECAFRGNVSCVQRILQCPWLMKPQSSSLQKLLNHTSQAGWTPLCQAAAQGHLEIAQLLVNANADVRMKSLSGKSALDLALENHHNQVAQFLSTHTQ